MGLEVPKNLQPLLDADVLRYEIAFAAETGWKATSGTDDIPPWEYVEKLLLDRINMIKSNCFTDKEPILYITEGPTFRYDIAKRKPYKGQRHAPKPWHFDNLTVYLRDILDAKVVSGVEADDQLAIDHVNSNGSTIVVSRDKDLMQVPGWFYKWELGNMASWGPDLITQEGGLKLGEKNKLTGTGLPWFYAQVLTGDTADNTPGLPGCGPVRAFELLNGKTADEMLSAVIEEYMTTYGNGFTLEEESIDRMETPMWEIELIEQGQLHWLLRKPGQVWEIGTIE